MGKDSIWIAFGLHIFLIVISVVAVGLNSLDLPAGYRPVHPYIPDNRIFLMSIAALLLVNVTYSATHATLLEQQAADEKIKVDAQQKMLADKQAIIERMERCITSANSV
ncbi:MULTISPECIES: hypothetical protein [unclassified Janthinobacterium]|uniref:hypothetical protein n=1 Tax=unclassified Janthinobacterium TaxID=2610881 RepID=UPI00160B1C7F|nr:MULTISPECIES: hypothetical protein [unclassified Janthinobacterium]MBB5610643.1 hypothetical protein [Janthinobacterium sp. S3T4]MBB5616129.1 hypothetical protein [Janthinobacterium sp. S3M3]